MDVKALLSTMYIIPYPTLDELKDCIFSDCEMEVTKLSMEDVNYEFSNFSDLKWLKPIAYKFDETHYNQAIHNLRNRIFFSLNTFDYYHKTTLKWIIIPYFQLIDSSYNLDVDTLTIIHLKDLIGDLKERLKSAKKKNIVGKFNFLNPQYIGCVIET